MAYINNARITEKMSRSKKVSGALETTAQRKLQNAKRELLSEFENDPVTKAIDAQEAGGNAGLLPNGSLWGFFGFEDGSQPAREVRGILEREVYIQRQSQPIVRGGKEVTQKFTINYVSPSELEQNTQLSWGGGSWIRGVENGLSGLARFIYWLPNALGGRSGAGVQAKRNIRAADTNTPKDYTTGMIERFLARIKTKFKV